MMKDSGKINSGDNAVKISPDVSLNTLKIYPLETTETVYCKISPNSFNQLAFIKIWLTPCFISVVFFCNDF